MYSCHLFFPGAQTVKRLLVMQETRVRFLGQEEPLEKEMAIHSSTLAWKIPRTEESDGRSGYNPWGQATIHGVAKSRTRLSDSVLSCPDSHVGILTPQCDGFRRSGL